MKIKRIWGSFFAKICNFDLPTNSHKRVIICLNLTLNVSHVTSNYCVKSAQIWSFSWSEFSRTLSVYRSGSHVLLIQYENWEIPTRTNFEFWFFSSKTVLNIKGGIKICNEKSYFTTASVRFKYTIVVNIK